MMPCNRFRGAPRPGGLIDTPEAWPALQLGCLIGGVSPTARVTQLRLIRDRRLVVTLI